MRIITEKQISEAVKELCKTANFSLRKDVRLAIDKALRSEKNGKASYLLKILQENYKLAEKESLPVCQDTGIAVIFAEIGNNVHVKGDIKKAINTGVKQGYREGYLRKSVVNDPLERKNTGTNTPALIYFDFVPGSRLKLACMPKGFGSENKSRLFMLNPTAKPKDIIGSVVKAVIEAGPDACPPYVVGVGLGGDAAKSSFLAKKALTMRIGFRGDKPHFKQMSDIILKECNRADIGPLGAGGRTTVLGVNILSFPTHIAGLPVAVNLSCHALRSASLVL
jgi:fumarate hydratase subunit alpha